jgi:hypothetical protein
MKSLRIAFAAAAILVGGVFAKPASASAIGLLNVSNCGGGGFTFTSTTIVWSPPTLGGTAGCLSTGPGTNVTYSGGSLGAGVTGDILNLTAGGGAVDSFMTFSGSTLDFVLTGLGPGSANTNCTGLAIGGSCSVFAGSPFLLTNVGAGNTAVSLGASGTILDGGVTSSWFGAFTTQVNIDASTIQSTILASGSVGSTYSGQFTVTSAVPEPSSLISMLVGGAGLFVRSLSRSRNGG